MPTPMVYPSGAAFATASVPIIPPAPGLFSTITGWPMRLRSGSARTRANVSGVEAAANGTMIRIGRCGQSCANAKVESSAPIAETTRLTGVLPQRERDGLVDGHRLARSPGGIESLLGESGA